MAWMPKIFTINKILGKYTSYVYLRLLKCITSFLCVDFDLNVIFAELAICPELNSRLMPTDVTADHDDFNQDLPDSFMAGHPTQASSPVHRGILGQIGGSFRSSLKGIKKLPSSSGKKKKKKSSGIEEQFDTTDMSGVDGELMTSVDVNHAEHAPWNEGERNEDGDENFQPGQMLEVAIHSQKLGIRDQSTPTHYQDYLDEENADAEQIPANMADLEIDPARSGGRKKKKSSKPKAARTASEVEQAVEASMMSSYMESDGMSDLGLEVTPAGARSKVKKSKKPFSSTPTNGAISFEESPLSSPPPTTTRPAQVTVDFDDDLPPPPPVVVEEGKVVKKKRPKVAKKPTTGSRANRSNNSGEQYSSQDGLEEEGKPSNTDI